MFIHHHPKSNSNRRTYVLKQIYSFIWVGIGCGYGIDKKDTPDDVRTRPDREPVFHLSVNQVVAPEPAIGISSPGTGTLVITKVRQSEIRNRTGYRKFTIGPKGYQMPGFIL